MILITGAQGLVGRELRRCVAALGHAVRGVDLKAADREQVIGAEASSQPTHTEDVVGDLLDADVCRRACDGAAAVVHAAARQYHDGVPAFGRRRFFDANVEMTRNLVEAAVAAGVRQIVCVSSDMVYGMPPDRPLRESDEPAPIGPYGQSKLAAEAACESAREVEVKVTVLRPRLIVGPGRLGVLRRLFEAIRRGKRVAMFGRGENRYQMVAVADVARACALALQGGVEGTFNLGSTEPPTVRELLSELIRRAGSRSKLRIVPKRPAVAVLRILDALRVAPLHAEQYMIAGEDYVLDTRAARERLGWQAQFSDTEMLWQAYQTYLKGRGVAAI